MKIYASCSLYFSTIRLSVWTVALRCGILEPDQPFQEENHGGRKQQGGHCYRRKLRHRTVHGIHVTVVELGDICTGFTKARQKSILGDEEYGGRISRSVSQMEHDEQNGMDPARIGRYIAGIVEKKNPAVVYVAGAQYKFLSLLCKLLPAAARGKIVGKLYG